jgi:hypothetical protein
MKAPNGWMIANNEFKGTWKNKIDTEHTVDSTDKTLITVFSKK